MRLVPTLKLLVAVAVAAVLGLLAASATVLALKLFEVV